VRILSRLIQHAMSPHTLSFALVSAPAQDSWAIAALPWIALLALAVAVAGVFGVWTLVTRLERIEALSKRFDALDEIRADLKVFAKERSDLDLRRIEHVLIELRDGQRRLEDSILRATQAALKPAPGAAANAGPAPHDPAERLIARVLAQGYERVLLVQPREELERLLASEGAHEVLVEARRNGVLCKGRVLLRDGAVTDVELTPAYTLFP
jgi:hypothetical protein